MTDFYPISPVVGITNTSYAAQAGVMNEMWAARLVRGKKILAEKTMKDLNLEAFVGVIYGHVRLPGLSRAAVAQCAGRLMQFARKYQQSGVCPNFEVPGLTRDDDSEEAVATGADIGADSVDSTITTQEPSSPALTPRPIGKLPDISPVAPNLARDSNIEAHAAVIGEMAAYGSELPEGHLALMFDRAAEALARGWATSDDPANPLIRFCETILSCSKEGQVPKTGRKLTVETGSCELLKRVREFEESGTAVPPNYPCAFHEVLAEKISLLTGVKIGINVSSTGCVVSVYLE